jgi:hypothetical protein
MPFDGVHKHFYFACLIEDGSCLIAVSYDLGVVLHHMEVTLKFYDGYVFGATLVNQVFNSLLFIHLYSHCRW